MKLALLSDIHANLAALEAVLAEAGKVDAIWNTGDGVGYGPQPVECIKRLLSSQGRKDRHGRLTPLVTGRIHHLYERGNCQSFLHAAIKKEGTLVLAYAKVVVL